MGPGTSPEKEREMGWLPVQVCSGERVGSLGSLALEPWLVFWRVEGTSRWARRECPGLRARFHRKEWGGGHLQGWRQDCTCVPSLGWCRDGWQALGALSLFSN